MLPPNATLIDVAFAVCTALDRAGERALLVGGSAATFYAPEAYQSSDCDFILALGPDAKNVASALEAIGFSRSTDGIFRHADLICTVEFPKGPAYIGIDRIEDYVTAHRGDELLYVFTPTDVIRDRFMHFWAWGDYNALRVALDVAKAQCSEVNYDGIVSWSEREIREAPAAYDLNRRDLFLADLRTILKIPEAP
jgi:hypothetical protein